ncbi:MAG: acyl dehydratase [Bacillus sp. (in: firmicutes)]|jgi:3-hydroxybutyryl-CoA dehydratase|uniref:MaoC family dehydratase n=1 Tax=Bacillus sp. 1NLA3E TaxID=666686 RepID=UPI000247F191|nr:MaoC family dehydratase [Bacillus sp. 1NLA3E]AGK53910.1 acyl dehydratase [Bacillus sp. 1NLA3E]MDF2903380.1 acyl dehydratase [Bacillus sp. (in: firmicutes)]
MQELSYMDINVGDHASFSKTISESDIYQFAGITGDFNPLHVDNEFAKNSIFKERISHGLLTAGFISTVIGMKLPGVNSIYLTQNLKFLGPVKIGDTVKAEVKVLEKIDRKKIIRLQTLVKNQHGEIVVDGEATVMKKV